MRKVWKSIIIVMMMTLLMGMTTQAAVKKITIKKPTRKSSYTVTLSKKQPSTSTRLYWTVSTKGKTNNRVRVKSSNTKVLSVRKTSNTTAIMTAKRAGKATITVYAGKRIKDTLKVTVRQKVTQINPKREYIYVVKGKTAKIQASILPKSANNKTVSYRSSNRSVATVDSRGRVTGKKFGTATITMRAKDGSGVTKRIYVTVGRRSETVTNLNAKIGATALYPKETTQITVNVAPKNARNKKVRFGSNNKAVATVTSKGVITARKAGTARVTVYANDGSGKRKTFTIKVKQPVTKVTLNQTQMKLATSDLFGEATSGTLTATVAPSDAANKAIKFSSSNPSVATVSDKGVVTAVAGGSAVITAAATDGSNVSDSCAVTVIDYTKRVLSVDASKFNTTYTINAKIAWNNPTAVLNTINDLLDLGSLPNRQYNMTLNGVPYVLSYTSTGGLSLKNTVNNQECITKLLSGYLLNGPVTFSNTIDQATFDRRLAELESKLERANMTQTFGSGTVMVNNKNYAVSDVVLKGKTMTFTLDGAKVVATLTNSKVEVISEGSIDDAINAVNAMLGNLFIVR